MKSMHKQNSQIIGRINGIKKIYLPQKRVNSMNSLKEINAKIEDVFNAEYDEQFQFILIKSESEFLKKITSNSLSFLNETHYIEIKAPEVQNILNTTEKIFKIKYSNNYKILSNALDKYINSPNSFNYLQRFRKHCSSTDSFALHLCGNKTSKLIEISENNNNNTNNINNSNNSNNILFLICSGCHKCFKSKNLKLYCQSCQCEYYSTVLSQDDNINIQQATWAKYHCGSVVNEKMKCIKCKYILYLNLISNMLICMNPNCKFTAKPESIIWICAICKKEFNSNARVYNPMEIQIFQKAIKKTLMLRHPAYPKIIPCCDKPPRWINFYHKKECKGALFLGEVSGREILVCEKCHAMNFKHNFIWTCPICLNKFRDPRNFSSEKIQMSNFLFELRKNNFHKQYSLSPNIKNLNVPHMKFSNKLNTSEYGFDNQRTTTENNEMPNRKRSQLLINISSSSELFNNSLFDSSKKSDSSGIGRSRDRSNNSQYKLQNKFESSFKRFNTQSDQNNSSMEYSINIPNEKTQCKLYLKPSKLSLNINSSLIEQSKVIQFDKPKYTDIQKRDDKNNKNIKKEELENKGNFDKSIANIGSPKRNNIIKKTNWDKLKNSSSNNIKVDIYKEIVENSNKKKNNSANKFSSKEIAIKDIFRNILLNNNIPLFNLEQFTIIKPIGQGSYGKIYLIQNSSTLQKYALKKIIVYDPKDIQNLHREFELIYLHKHDNIMKIFNIQFKIFDMSNFGIYLLMELADSDWNEEIKKRGIKKKYYKEEELINILKQIVKALAYLQLEKIAHRDIKPQNILIYPNSVYKVADLGEAKEIKQPKQQNTLKGTELFMAPALLNGLKENKKGVVHNAFKSDVFSLGYCVLYACALDLNLLVKIRNIKDMNEVSRILNIQFIKKYSKEFEMLLMKMIDYDELKRFDFVELEKYLEDFKGKD